MKVLALPGLSSEYGTYIRHPRPNFVLGFEALSNSYELFPFLSAMVRLVTPPVMRCEASMSDCSHRLYFLISFGKSTPPQNRQNIVYYLDIKLTILWGRRLSKTMMNTFYEIRIAEIYRGTSLIRNRYPPRTPLGP